ncbi:hypothetical protein ACI7RC_15165 [Brevibacillus sp. B_LB10_24]
MADHNVEQSGEIAAALTVPFCFFCVHDQIEEREFILPLEKSAESDTEQR